jgi:hypothetical protein
MLVQCEGPSNRAGLVASDELMLRRDSSRTILMLAADIFVVPALFR